MPSEILMKQKTPIVWADLTDYSSVISGLTRTRQIDLTGILNGAAREGQMADLGVDRFHEYLIAVGIEYLNSAPPTEGEFCDFYFAQSVQDIATANVFPGGVTGVDGVYNPAFPNLAAGLATLGPKFQLTLDDRVDTDTPGVQYGIPRDSNGIGRLITPLRYIVPVFVNSAATGDLFTDAVEMFITLIGITPESQ